MLAVTIVHTVREVSSDDARRISSVHIMQADQGVVENDRLYKTQR